MGNHNDRCSSSAGGWLDSRGTASIHYSMAKAMMEPTADDVAAHTSFSPRVGPFWWRRTTRDGRRGLQRAAEGVRAAHHQRWDYRGQGAAPFSPAGST